MFWIWRYFIQQRSDNDNCCCIDHCTEQHTAPRSLPLPPPLFLILSLLAAAAAVAAAAAGITCGAEAVAAASIALKLPDGSWRNEGRGFYDKEKIQLQ